MKIILDVIENTGITATAGIGTNLYLCKVAMDILAKHIPADENGVRIAELDEMKFRRELWPHRPLTDFWRIGGGYAKKLEKMGLYTMGDIARYSEHGERALFQMFGVAAELLIDHAWGYEPCTMKAIKTYQPKDHSISQGQVLPCPYDWQKGRLIIREMTELLVLDLVRKKLAADQIVLSVGYDHTGIPENYQGELNLDRYGKRIPKAAHGSVNLGKHTASTRLILEKVTALYDRIVDAELLVRRMNVTANHLIPEHELIRRCTGAGTAAKAGKNLFGKGTPIAENHAAHQGAIREKCHSERHEFPGRCDNDRTKQPGRRTSGMNDYSDIRSHERYHLKNHIPMPMENRAVQFAPFAALTGYDEEIHEAARLTDPMENLSDDALATLNLHFQQLLEHAAERPRVRVTYFQPDSKKVGGAYAVYTGCFRFFDAEKRCLKFTNGTAISAERVCRLEFLSAQA